MKGFVSFFNKELRELVRTGRLLLLVILGVIFGVMNPAVAKLTPWLMEQMADTLEGTGLMVTSYTVTAADSWTQFFKNSPMGLRIVLILFSGAFTNEYAKGTLVPLLTKGLSRGSMAAAKTAMLLGAWSGFYWLTFGITYAYTAYFWDNSVVSHLAFAAFGYWLMGVFLLCVTVFVSSFATSSGQVLVVTGCVYGMMVLLGLWGKFARYLPTFLTDSASLLSGVTQPSDVFPALVVTAALSLALLLLSIPLTAKRKL